MKRKLLLITILIYVFNYATAQGNFSIKVYAGSNAPWGKSQFLSIDSKGKAKYDLSEVNKGVIDSLTFIITQAELRQLDEVVNQMQFFKLAASYNAQSFDGTRLSVEVSISDKSHTVNWINIHTAETNILLDKLNNILKSKKINIHY